MKRTLKEYAELLNNHNYGDNFDKDLLQEMKENGIVIAYGYSDDLFELNGALRLEYDCYSDAHFIWYPEESEFVSIKKIDDLLDTINYDYPVFYKTIKNALKLNENTFIKIKHPSDAQFKYETNIPCEWFDIIEDDELYCKGFVFDVKSLKNNGEN